MPSYRGVSQDDVVSSVNDALALMESYSTGPVSQKFIKGLRKPDASGQSKLDAIAAAQDDLSLVYAVRTSGVMWLFARTHQVLEFHALNNTDGKGLDVFKRLSAWSAMSSGMTMEFNKLDAELEAYFGRRSIKSLFNKAAASLKEKQEALKCEPAMRQYGLVIDALTEGKIDLKNSYLQVVRAKVEKAIEPFWQFDEIDMTGVGFILNQSCQKGDPQGVFFKATRRVAQAVADAFLDRSVIDEKGDAVPSQFQPDSPEYKYRQALAYHDWFYEYSDDFGVWKKGSAAQADLVKMQKALDPDHTVWNLEAPEQFQKKREDNPAPKAPKNGPNS